MSTKSHEGQPLATRGPSVQRVIFQHLPQARCKLVVSFSDVFPGLDVSWSWQIFNLVRQICFFFAMSSTPRCMPCSVLDETVPGTSGSCTGSVFFNESVKFLAVKFPALATTRFAVVWQLLRTFCIAVLTLQHCPFISWCLLPNECASLQDLGIAKHQTDLIHQLNC